MSFLPADRRLAGVLASLSAENDVVHVSQEELGSLAGTTRVTVNRALQAFQHAGWVTLGYRSVCVCNRTALEKYAKVAE